MTAIVGVLNKHGVAIAADSAVTMGNTHKVVNSANKIFTLSKYEPVAVMTYNSAAFMGTPWDIIIKEYRRQLRDISFLTLKDYVDDFISFLHARNFFCNHQTQKRCLLSLLDFFYKLCCAETAKDNKVPTSGITQEMVDKKLSYFIKLFSSEEKSPEFLSYSFDEFKEKAGEDILNYLNGERWNNVNLWIEAFFYFFTSAFLPPFYTGLVFVGYGTETIYPALFPINVVMGFDGKLKYVIDSDKVAKIDEQGPSSVIVPFAQTDVTDTIMRGINPSFLDIIYRVVGKSFRDYTKAITDILDSHSETMSVSSAIKRLDSKTFIENTINQIKTEMFSKYTKPLLATVRSLDKEDMANMAESFISLTSLVRRMQPGEETVGGPVDVAFISKGDGFVWINRKHYFKPELNAHFFSNYFR